MTTIVWICHFTSDEIQSLLPLWNKQDEFAPWIPSMLRGFEDIEDFEIHVVAPHEYLKKSTNFIIRNIHYNFIPYGMPFWNRHWPDMFSPDIYTNYFFFRKKVRKTIKQIKPDLINLIGAENAYYSSTILDFKKEYPILITIQGLISQMRGEIKRTPLTKKYIAVEEEILTKFQNFAGEQDSSTYISTYNPYHVFFKFYGNVNEELVIENKDKGKIYDCMYFGRLEKIKGAEDLIKVIAEIKIKKPDVKALIIGDGKVNPLLEIAKELNCSANIEFKGFLKTQKELFEYVKASKVFLAPPYFERLSMTIREAMFLKVPIVAYATGGIPYINEHDENILMVETGNYKAMAEKALWLLNNEKERIALAEKAYNYAQNEFSLKVNTERLISAYRKIISE